MLDWLIIGGGIQGCTLATYLLRHKKTSIQQLGIIDPHQNPLHKWIQNTSILEMPFLRSPSIHHLDVEPFALERYAKKERSRFAAAFTLPYDRPSLELFNEHSRDVLGELEIPSAWIKGKAAGMIRKKDYWCVVLDNGKEIESKHVVLAMGLSEHPHWPEWATKAKDDGGQVYHIFSKAPTDFTSLTPPIVLVGGGISAAHTAIRLCKLYPGQITLVTRHELRIHQFDSDPAWLGPKNMNPYRTIKDFQKRRQMILSARHRGSMPTELYLALMKEQKLGNLSILTNQVENTQILGGQVLFQFTDQSEVLAGSVMLATGFHTSPPGMDWLEPTLREQNMRCGVCGYPIVSSVNLEWTDGLFVMGPLAELEIGPVSRNIAGARRAAERILQAT
ncbi:FAD/NAD(P)-binding protein [Ammoniphilus sp. CFH 90114]|uniref:FAD/NAD(P)-binding protein n=1 Tax=Ammoniphilus sp. CFH 90114 TaxID=2493665 RepID=UPI00100E3575|nr:FAD/NAD(P)-binding protein [Ammoniphilus sp. CFH 90114]RXT13751.1 hypothetical protein EIZ39_06285 [Ammoniphilus sp. CFH 90114]